MNCKYRFSTRIYTGEVFHKCMHSGIDWSCNFYVNWKNGCTNDLKYWEQMVYPKTLWQKTKDYFKHKIKLLYFNTHTYTIKKGEGL